MTEFTFPRFSDRRNLNAPAPGVTIDLFTDENDVGTDDSIAEGSDDPVVVGLQFRIAPGGIGRVFMVEV